MNSRLFRILIAFASLLAAIGARAQINTEQVMRIGQNALYFDDYVLSIQYFNQVIQAKPYLAQPYLMRAIAKFNLDDFDGALADASTCIKINPFIPDAWELRGASYQNVGNDSAAIVDYDHALELLPRNKQILFNKALAQTNISRFDDADSTYAELLGNYPNFDNGYIGRAKLRLEKGDTISAEGDIDKALGINANAYNGYILRAMIATEKHHDFAKALDDMNMAVKLEPKHPGLYINRAFLRYSLDDYFGAMADYDYALQLEPLNGTALFNRSLLQMEVGNYDGAIKDLSTILKLNPNDDKAIYNRAVAYGERGSFDEAISDISDVIKHNPDLSSAYFLRSEYYRQKGEMRKSESDYNKGRAIAKTRPSEASGIDSEDDFSAEAAARKFNALLTIENQTQVDEEYNNSAIRGRVQDRDLAIEIAPLVELSYYAEQNELANGTYYIKEIDEINSTRLLRFVILVVASTPSLSHPDLIKKHFDSVDYYNSYIATHKPRAIDFIGRAMDFITLKNYEAAISDLDKALELTPDQPAAYFMRAQARFHNRLSEQQAVQTASLSNNRTQLMLALADLDKAIELSPRMAPGWYNKGNVHYELGDYTSAIAAYNKAIELSPNMGNAYYNRGYVYLKMGNQAAGIADLSKAGELGVVSAYNLIKRVK